MFYIPKTPTDVELQCPIDRFARARWITGTNVDHPLYYQIELTDLGARKLAELGRTILPFHCPTPRPSLMARIRLWFGIRRTLRDLQPPKLSASEIETILGLALMHIQLTPAEGNGRAN